MFCFNSPFDVRFARYKLHTTSTKSTPNRIIFQLFSPLVVPSEEAIEAVEELDELEEKSVVKSTRTSKEIVRPLRPTHLTTYPRL
jgi:hypothetical protein